MTTVGQISQYISGFKFIIILENAITFCYVIDYTVTCYKFNILE